MNQPTTIQNQLFLNKLSKFIEKTLQNDQFGVNELAAEAALSKSRLNHKLNDELLSEESGKTPWRKILILSTGALLIAFSILFSSAYGYKSSDNASDEVYEEKSIAVLPFKNLSDRAEDQLFADAIANQILTHLQRLPINEISVRSGTSSERYRDSGKSVIEIANELDVNYILEGSVQKLDNRAIIYVRLIDAKLDHPIWAQQYDRDWSDIFKVQKQVARMVATKLVVNFTEEATKALDIIPTNNDKAYIHYLKGKSSFRSYWKRSDASLLKNAEKNYLKALKLDDKFSYPYAGLGEVYIHYAQKEDDSESIRSMGKARTYLEKAIELDPYNGWAYSELATIMWQWYGDSTVARSMFDVALRLEPNNQSCYDNYYQLELRLGKCIKMAYLLQKLQRIFLYARYPYNVYPVKYLMCNGAYAEITDIADTYWRNGLTIVNARLFFYGYMQSEDFDKAYSMAEYVMNRSKSKEMPYQLMGVYYGTIGEEKEALSYIEKLQKLANRHHVPNVTLARIYASMGMKDQMYDHLELALLGSERTIRHIHSANEFIPYRDEPRFKAIWSRAWIPAE